MLWCVCVCVWTLESLLLTPILDLPPKNPALDGGEIVHWIEYLPYNTRNWVQIPRAQERLVVPACNSSAPKTRWETEIGELSEAPGPAIVTYPVATTKRPCLKLDRKWEWKIRSGSLTSTCMPYYLCDHTYIWMHAYTHHIYTNKYISCIEKTSLVPDTRAVPMTEPVSHSPGVPVCLLDSVTRSIPVINHSEQVYVLVHLSSSPVSTDLISGQFSPLGELGCSQVPGSSLYSPYNSSLHAVLIDSVSRLPSVDTGSRPFKWKANSYTPGFKPILGSRLSQSQGDWQSLRFKFTWVPGQYLELQNLGLLCARPISVTPPSRPALAAPVF
jgi:hypothetical protein